MTNIFDNFVRYILEYTSFVDLPEKPPYGFWISPGGSFYPVGFQKHDSVAMNVINSTPSLSKEFDDLEDKTDVYEFLQKRKWLRVVKSTNSVRTYLADCFVYNIDVLATISFVPTQKSLKTLKDICEYYFYDLQLVKE